MDNKSEDGTLRGNSIEAEQTGTPPREKRAAAIRATKLIPIPFQPGGAFDSQVTSQEFVKGLYEDAEQFMHGLKFHCSVVINILSVLSGLRKNTTIFEPSLKQPEMSSEKQSGLFVMHNTKLNSGGLQQ
ncbi:hypothetical protein B0H14DRAFT_3897613 [Mycena olivaceomarginata]|nr:hypothetical protein B0H14DRAFT_3897613 [Mycena olivaceomarginata]